MRVALNSLATDKPVALKISQSNWNLEMLVSQSNWNLEMLVQGGKPENLEKNLWSKERSTNKLNPHMTPGLSQTCCLSETLCFYPFSKPILTSLKHLRN